MKKLNTLLLLLFICTTSAFAQTPEKLSYQAIIRNSSDMILANQSVGIQVSILQNSAVGSTVYVETQNPNTNANGLVNLEIGTGTLVSGDFGSIDWAGNTYFIKTEIDPTGGSSYSITGTSQLMSVPYALHAKSAEIFTGTVTEIDPTFSSSEAKNITASDITKLSNLSGSNTGDQNITGIATNSDAIVNIKAEQTTQNLAIAVNTSKAGISTAQANEITANTLKTSYTDATAVTANTAKISYTDAAAVAANTAKVGISTAQANEITANTLKTSYTDAAAVTANTAKISYTDAAAVAANTAKVGVSTAQANEITANTLKISYTDAAAVTANTAKQTNATHTGDVTGATALTITNDAVTIAKIGTAGATDANKILTTDSSGDPQWSTTITTYIVGEIKQTIGAMPVGWVKLEGQTIASLTATQQTNATSLSLSGSLPDATDAYLSQNGETLGSISGTNEKAIQQNNLPNVSLSGSTNTAGNHTHTPTGSYTKAVRVTGLNTSANQDDAGTGEIDVRNSGTISLSTTGNHSHTVTTSSINGGVTQQAIDTAPKTLSINTYIYLGE